MLAGIVRGHKPGLPPSDAIGSAYVPRQFDQFHRVSVVASVKMRRVRCASILNLSAIPTRFVLLTWSNS